MRARSVCGSHLQQPRRQWGGAGARWITMGDRACYGLSWPELSGFAAAGSTALGTTEGGLSCRALGSSTHGAD